jgi:hypothetical protein
MNKIPIDRESILKELQEILEDLETTFTSCENDKDKLQSTLEKHKNRLQFLCGIYEELDLPEIDNFEFHETYSQEYKHGMIEQYLELSSIDKKLYKCYVLVSNYEYLFLERIGLLEGEDIKIAGLDVLNGIKKVFLDIDGK